MMCGHTQLRVDWMHAFESLVRVDSLHHIPRSHQQEPAKGRITNLQSIRFEKATKSRIILPVNTTEYIKVLYIYF